ncbi:MAG: hypothetical protein FWH24_03570 [Oscillospiraceae bacterium]|nr:hypothetical protein [Oscillospiraceae bacterium]
MIYFGENNDYIMCECEICKREIYAERENVAEEDAYSYHLAHPLRCSCGSVDEYINKSKKSCHHIRGELSALCGLLNKQYNIAAKINGINAEITKKFNPPTFWQSLAADFIFAGKIFLIVLGAAIGLEVLLFIIALLIFFGGLLANLPDLSIKGNEFFYAINVFKNMGGRILSIFGMDAGCPELDPEIASEQVVLNYIPYAITGLVLLIFYIFLAVFITRALVNISKLTIFASKVMNQRIKLNRQREAYERELGELKREYNSLDVKIDEFDIIGEDYKNVRAAEMILRYFTNNRADTVREALNLYHEEDFRQKQLEYSRALYTEAKQTRRYTKAMYMLTSDSSIKVEVRDEPPAEPAAAPAPGADAPKNPKIKKSGIAGKISAPAEKNPEIKPEERERPPKAEPVKSEPDIPEVNEKNETFSSIFGSDEPEENMEE